MRSLRLIALLSASALAQSNSASCLISENAEKDLRAIPALSDLNFSWQERYLPRMALAKKYSRDWPLQFLTQDPILNKAHMGREWDAAIAHYRSLDDRSLGTILEARLFSTLYRKKTREMLDTVEPQATGSPWFHLVRLEWAMSPIQGDSALVAKELEIFRRLCPESFRAFRYLEHVKDSEKLYGHVRDLRRLLDARKKTGLDDEQIMLFRSLWTWEGILHGDGGRADFERTVRADLAFLRQHPAYDSSAWIGVLRFGYEQTLKDTAALAALETEILNQAPPSLAAYNILESRWEEENPRPARPSREESDAYMQRRRDANLALFDRFPAKVYNAFSVLMFLNDRQFTLPSERVTTLADAILSKAERFPDYAGSWPPVEIIVADVYVRRKIRLDRVPEMLAKGLEQIEVQEKHRRDSDLFTGKSGNAIVDNFKMAQRRVQEVEVRLAIATGQSARARALLSDMRDELLRTRPADSSGRTADPWRGSHYTYQQLCREAGIDASPVADILPLRPEQAERLPVAAFEAKDLSGKTWRLQDLKGKIVYLNVWTTWCGPCRAEMPALQKLHERWKDRKDRAVLTISADLHPSLVVAFLRDTTYTFPVLVGKEIAEKVFPPVYFPQNWWIDAEGRRLDVRAPMALDSMLSEIEDLAEKISSR